MLPWKKKLQNIFSMLQQEAQQPKNYGTIHYKTPYTYNSALSEIKGLSSILAFQF